MDLKEAEERLIRCEKAIARQSAVLELRKTVISRLAWGAHSLVREELEKDLALIEAQARNAELSDPNPPTALVREIKHDALLDELAFIRSALHPENGPPSGWKNPQG